MCANEGIKSQYRYTLADRTEWYAFNLLCFHNNTRKTSSCCPRVPRRPRTTLYTSCTPWRFSCCTTRHCRTSATCHCRTEYGAETQEGSMIQTQEGSMIQTQEVRYTDTGSKIYRHRKEVDKSQSVINVTQYTMQPHTHATTMTTTQYSFLVTHIPIPPTTCT